MSTALRLDTLSFSKRLRNAGADEALAEAIVEGITGADTSELATKADLREVESALKSDLREVESALKSDIADVKSEIAAVRTELKLDMANSENRTVMKLAGLLALFFMFERFLPFLSAAL